MCGTGYAAASQIRHWGRDPAEWLIEVRPCHPRQSCTLGTEHACLIWQVQPRKDSLLHTEDIIAAIEANKGRLALVMLGGVNYLSGQV